MPYDPRPVTEGGNAGIDKTFTRAPTEGKYRVVWVDTFDGSDGVEGDYPDFESAKEVADKNGGTMSMYHVYDPDGKHVYSAGTF